MTVQTQVVRFQKETTGVDGTTQDVSLNFTPKAIIVISDFSTANNTVSANYVVSHGFSDGTNNACVGLRIQDGDTSPSSGNYHFNDACIGGNNSGSLLTIKDFQGSAAFITNGVRFTWTDNVTTGFYITVYAIGGSDITNVKVNTVEIGTTSTGARSYTGLGFTPTTGKGVLFTLAANFTTSLLSDNALCSVGLGCAVSSSKRWSYVGNSESSVDPSDTWRVQYNDKCLSTLDSSGALHYHADFNGWVSDGFELNITDAASSSTYVFSYLVINGGNWDCGSLQSPTTPTNNVDTSISVNSQTPRGLLMATVASGTLTTIQTNNILSIGATDGTNQGCIGVIDEDNQATTDNYRVNNTTNIIRPLTTNGAALDTATFDSFQGTSAFRLDWGDADSTARYYGWVVVADSPTSQLFEVPLTESSITVGDGGTAARMLSANRALSESAITVGAGTAARMLAPASRSISETAITVGAGTAARLRIVPRTIEEDPIDVDETVDRLRTAFGAITESAISVNETVDRLFTGSRSLDEDPIDVDEDGDGHKLVSTELEEDPISVGAGTLDRQLFAFRTISETAISVSESLDRLRTAFAAISEDPISVSDAVARTKIFPREITETGIDVEETLTKMSSFFRTLSESSIDVDEEVERVKTIIRTINESSISVSDSVARLLSAFRTLSETAITVGAGTAARLATFLRSISESSISVSESIETDDTRLVSLVETAISVTDSLTRQLKAFRTVSESAIIISDAGSNGILVVPVLAEFITDPGYTNPVRLKLVFKSKKGDTEADESGDQIIYYNYDSWVPSDKPFNLINFSMRLTQGEISSATLEIEDHAERIDDPRKIFYKAEVEVYFKKELGRDWTKMMTGVVRRLKHLRPAHSALHYQLTVVSKQIIYLERILNFARAAKRDGIITNIPLSTDTEMQVNNLFKEVHTTKTGLPNRRKETIQETGDFDLTTGSISDDVIDFITQVNSGLTTAADFLNQLTEGTGALWGVDADGNPYLRYPTEKHSGIILKDSPVDTDSATNTSICMDAFEFEDIVDTTEGFANSLYVLNSKDVKVMNDSSSKSSGFSTLTTRWIAQSFIANENNVTGAAFILSLRGTPTNENGTIRGELRANNLVGGVNYPTGPILTSFEISFSQLATAKDTIFVNDLNTKDGTVIPGQRYWWVLKGTGLLDDSNTVKWHHDNDYVNPNRISAYLPITTLDLDPTTPGVQAIWQVRTTGPQYAFSTFSSINHILTQSDPESINEVGLIEQVVNLPSFDDDATFQKVLVKMLQTSSKIKRVYDYARVTIPTARFFFPGELVTVIDSKAKLDADKFVNAEIVEVNYTVDTTRNALGVKYVDLRMIGFVDTVTNNFLDNKEC